jgi:hypothetical protein
LRKTGSFFLRNQFALIHTINNLEATKWNQFALRRINLTIPPESIDYGDGTRVPWKETTEHSYKHPGLYVVTFRGGDNGSGTGVFHVRVVVE